MTTSKFVAFLGLPLTIMACSSNKNGSIPAVGTGGASTLVGTGGASTVTGTGGSAQPGGASGTSDAGTTFDTASTGAVDTSSAPTAIDAAAPSADAPRSGLVGLWNGSSLTANKPATSAVPFLVLVDDEGNVYLAETDGSGRGTGTVSSSGDVVISVSGGVMGVVTFVGKIAGDEGSGSWTNTSTGNAGTWTIARRKDVVVSPGARATCDRMVPCMGSDNDPLAVVNCMMALAVSTPLVKALLGQLGPCLSAASCDGRWACLDKGTLPKVYVSPAGNDANDGATPDRPKQSINAAAVVAQSGGTVLIAAGTYRENVLVGKPLTLEGGYDAAFTRADPATSAVTIDGQAQESTLLVFTTVHSSRFVAKGLRIIGGATQASFGGNGGGLSLSGSPMEVLVEDCVFAGNHAAASGGGIHATSSKLTIHRCAFDDNAADGNGGGINISDGTLVVTASTFRNNRAGDYGGAVNSWQTSAAFEGVTATGNSARQCGGALQLGGDMTHTLKDSTLTGNAPNNTCGPYTSLGGNTMN